MMSYRRTNNQFVNTYSYKYSNTYFYYYNILEYKTAQMLSINPNKKVLRLKNTTRRIFLSKNIIYNIGTVDSLYVKKLTIAKR